MVLPADPMENEYVPGVTFPGTNESDATDRRPLDRRAADSGRRIDRRQVLPQEPRLLAAGADVFNAKGLAGDHGQAERRPQDLSAAFAEGAVDLDWSGHGRLF